MKRLISLPSGAEVGLLQSRLQAAGIPSEVRNEFSAQVIPAVAFESELWVLNDADYEPAMEMMAAWKTGSPVSEEPGTP